VHPRSWSLCVFWGVRWCDRVRILQGTIHSASKAVLSAPAARWAARSLPAWRWLSARPARTRQRPGIHRHRRPTASRSCWAPSWAVSIWWAPAWQLKVDDGISFISLSGSSYLNTYLHRIFCHRRDPDCWRCHPCAACPCCRSTRALRSRRRCPRPSCSRRVRRGRRWLPRRHHLWRKKRRKVSSVVDTLCAP